MSISGTKKESKRVLRLRMTVFPILIGLGISYYLLQDEFKEYGIPEFTLSLTNCLLIFVIILLASLRDLAYMYRIRIITDKVISWKNSFNIIFLWEFASAVTPSIVGGSSVAFYILYKEGLSPGKSTATVLITALFDELFLIIFAPFTILLVGSSVVFNQDTDLSIFGTQLPIKSIFYVGYGILSILSIVLFSAIFVAPNLIRKIILLAFNLPVLRLKKEFGLKFSNDLETSSIEFRNKPAFFWLQIGLATAVSWLSRYSVLIFIILLFTPLSSYSIVIAKQLVMWIIMLVSPTPGSSGIAEYIFTLFLAGLIPVSIISSLAILWRLVTFYPYLFIGALILPGWTKRKFAKP
ncbi:MAG: flippase-like domain-containing protein [Flavobacteriales bacterium]|nr:flippase-like domain-containing protein [Flavobacteriales bacterium]